MAFSLNMIGFILIQENDTRGARSYLDCAMTLMQELGDRRHVEATRITQGMVCYRVSFP
jgi:hypothetical protein